LASSPTPETQVRVACACADPAKKDNAAAIIPIAAKTRVTLAMAMPPVLLDPFARRPRLGKPVDTAQEYVELTEKASEPRTN
jgi:hypothetical protein